MREHLRYKLRRSDRPANGEASRQKSSDVGFPQHFAKSVQIGREEARTAKPLMVYSHAW